MEPIIELKNISGRKIRKLSLCIYPSEKLIILGPSGCGKTTLLRIINALDDPEDGGILYCGKSIREYFYPDIRRKVILLPQIPVVMEGSVHDNLKWAHGISSSGDKAIDPDWNRCLDVVGIKKHADRPAEHLSVGEKKRLNLAMGFSLNPELMLLDEPTSALDPSATESIHSVINELNSEGVSFVIVTHSFSEAFKLADKVGIMLDGQLRQYGLKTEILRNPADAGVAEFLNSHRRNDA